jgi:Putative zinc-finger
MDHDYAVRLSLVEKYLLEELPPELRDEFEEHYFDCKECSEDLRAASVFLDAAKSELSAMPLSKTAPPVPDRTADKTPRARKSWFSWMWTPTFVVPALAACLLVIAYQNLVILPHFRSGIAELRSPQILPTLSLVGGNSRGGSAASIAVAESNAFLVLIDIPTQDRFSSYTCLLYSPSGSLAWRVQVSGQEAKDTVSIRVPAERAEPGSYSLVVQGNSNTAPAENGVELARYRFTLTR